MLISIIISFYAVTISCAATNTLTHSMVRVHSYANQGHILRYRVEATVYNFGNESIQTYDWVLPIQNYTRLTSVGITIDDDTLVPWQVNIDEERLLAVYTIELKTPLFNKEAIKVVIKYSLCDVMTPLPATITLSQDQPVTLYSSSTFLSPYTSELQEIFFHLPTRSREGTLISYDPKDDAQVDRNAGTIRYDTFKVGPYTWKAVRLYFVNNAPFATVMQAIRVIHIQPFWDVVSFEDSFHLRHDGATLTGPYSRVTG